MMKLIKRFETLDETAKASFAYVIVGFIQKGLSLISGPIFTRILSQADYGLFSSYNSWYELIGVAATLSLSAGVYNNGLMEFDRDRDTFTFSLLLLSNLSTVIVGIIGLLFTEQTLNLIRLPVPLFCVMFVSFWFSPALIFWTARQRYEYKYIRPCIITAISSTLAVFASIMITIWSNDSNKLINKILSEKAILLLFWAIAYVYIAVKAKFCIQFKYWVYALKFNLPLIPHYLSNYVLNSMDRLMIVNMVSAEAAAVYSVSYSAAFLVQIFWQSMNSAILPITYEKIKNNKLEEINNIIVPFISIYGVLCVFISFIAPEILSVLAPDSYREGIYIVPILMIGVYFTGLYCLFANVEFYYKSTKFIALTSTISALTNFGLNYVFIKMFGYQAAAFTTAFSYMIQTLLHYANYRRISKQIYKDGLLVTITFLVIGGTLITLPLYEFSVFRYGFIVIMLIIASIKHEVIIKICRNIINR